VPSASASGTKSNYKDDHGPYFSSLNLTNPTEARSPNIIFTGIPVGPANLFPGATFHPEVAISNFSAQPAQVTVTLAHTIGGKTSAELVQKLALAAHSSKTVQIPAHGDPAMTNSLTVRSSLPPGEVVAQFVAWGDSSIRTVEMQAKDNDSPQNGGGHPWSTEGGTTSTLFLFNHSSASARKIAVQISNGSELWRKSYLLASMQTEAVNVNEIVANAIPDDQGHILSKGAREGQVAWIAGFAKWGKGRLMMSRPQEGLARSFSCGTCTSDCANATLSPHSSLTVPVGGQGPLGDVIVQDCSINCHYSLGCGSTPVSQADLSFIQWQNQTPNITQLLGGPLTVTVKGLSPGVGTIIVHAQDDAGQGYECMAAGWGQVNVVSATITQRTSGAVSVDDAALSAYSAAEGTTNLGAIIGNGTGGQGCFIGNEAVGVISPSSYAGTVTVHRWILNYAEYANSAQTGSGTNEDDTLAMKHSKGNTVSLNFSAAC
jgi:hypothetical protein